jgi:hypothetical protein
MCAHTEDLETDRKKEGDSPKQVVFLKTKVQSRLQLCDLFSHYTIYRHTH